MKTLRDVREDYINRFRDLQRKRIKDHEKFVIVALLMAYMVDFLETRNASKYLLVAPFFLKIKNIENAKAVVNAIDEAFDGRGKLAESLKMFKETNQKTLSSLNNIIPQIEPKIKLKGETARSVDIQNELKFSMETNKSNLLINEMILNKRMKQWNTQRDSRVRKTTFHNGVDFQIVPIDDYFEVPPFRARFPVDEQLPPFDRIGCRCYLTFYE